MGKLRAFSIVPAVTAARLTAGPAIGPGVC
jgi:hypothetical protein